MSYDSDNRFYDRFETDRSPKQQMQDRAGENFHRSGTEPEKVNLKLYELCCPNCGKRNTTATTTGPPKRAECMYCGAPISYRSVAQ